jgi:hypothetical protein
MMVSTSANVQIEILLNGFIQFSLIFDNVYRPALSSEVTVAFGFRPALRNLISVNAPPTPQYIETGHGVKLLQVML